MPADGMFGVGVDILSGMEIIVMATPAIILAFVVGAVYAEDVLVDLLTVILSDVVSAIDVGMLVDENANRLAAVMTPLESTQSSP